MKALACISIALVSSVVSVARADVPPPDDYVEKCTLANQRREGEHCIMRNVHVMEPIGATLYLKEMGFCRRCNTYGATVRGEIDCRPEKDAKPLPDNWPEEAKKRDSAIASSTPSRDRPQLTDCSINVMRDSPTRDTPNEDGDGDLKKPKSKSGCGCALSDAEADKTTTPSAGLGVVLLGLVAACRRAASKRVSPRR